MFCVTRKPPEIFHTVTQIRLITLKWHHGDDDVVYNKFQKAMEPMRIPNLTLSDGIKENMFCVTRKKRGFPCTSNMLRLLYSDPNWIDHI